MITYRTVLHSCAAVIYPNPSTSLVPELLGQMLVMRLIERSRMKLLSRLATVIVVFPVTYYIAYLFTAGLLYGIAGNTMGETALQWISIGLSPLAAGFSTWITWKNIPTSIPQVLGTYILLGGLLTGGFGFFLGVYGPFLLGYERSLTSLLGILITGPLGFIIGAIAGGIVWGVQRQRLSG